MKTKFKALFLVGGGLLVISGVGCASSPGDSNDYRNKPSEPAGTAGSGGMANTSLAEGGDSGGAADDSGGSDDGLAGSGATMEASGKDITTACKEYAVAECHKIAQCNPWLIAAYFEDEAACVKRYETTSGCTARFALRGTSQTVAGLAACTSALTSSTCAEWLDLDPTALAACAAKPGALADGAGCGNDGSAGIDCAVGGFCRITGSGTQGTCVLPAKDGQACDDQDGPSCLPWATCMGGLCKVSDPAACR